LPEEIAGDLAGGLEADGDLEALHLGLVVGEEDGLEIAGSLEVFVESALALVGARKWLRSLRLAISLSDR
jgi:hypothetical protein